MQRRSSAPATSQPGSLVLIALAVLTGLLWAGTLNAEMKWTATIFGLALGAFLLKSRP